MPSSQNRSLWPVGGGAVAIQPGWFQGHATAFFYINLGYGTIPINMSNPMIPAFQIVGPSKNPYPGTFCLPQVPLPVNATVKAGDNATIQIIETAVHGAALYNVSITYQEDDRGEYGCRWNADLKYQCVDITFADPQDVPEVNASNCFNSSDIGFQLVYSTTSLSEASAMASAHLLAFVPLLIAGLFQLLS
jgi:hypothetical protein